MPSPPTFVGLGGLEPYLNNPQPSVNTCVRDVRNYSHLVTDESTVQSPCVCCRRGPQRQAHSACTVEASLGMFGIFGFNLTSLRRAAKRTQEAYPTPQSPLRRLALCSAIQYPYCVVPRRFHLHHCNDPRCGACVPLLGLHRPRYYTVGENNRNICCLRGSKTHTRPSLWELGIRAFEHRTPEACPHRCYCSMPSKYAKIMHNVLEDQCSPIV